MCDSKIIKSNPLDYQYVFGINLTKPSDPIFKLAQLLVFRNYSLLFDLRQTNKGKKSRNGICLHMPEFFWMKRILLGETKFSILEHDQRIIIIEKIENKCMISVTKPNSITNSILLEEIELQNLIKHLNNFESNILNLSSRCGYEIDFKPFAYINEKNE